MKLTDEQKTQLEKFRETISKLASEIDNYSADCEDNDDLFNALQDAVATLEMVESELELSDEGADDEDTEETVD